MGRRVIATLLAVAALALAGCSAGRDAVDANAAGQNRYVPGDGETRVYPVGQRTAAPAVTGDLVGGGTYDLAAHRGDVVVLNFWASWCAPCRAEASDLAAVAAASKARGVDFVGVNIRDQQDAARSFETAQKVPYPSLFDPPGRTALGFKVPPNTIPATFVVDRHGRIAAVIRKAVLRDELQRVVDGVAAES